MKTFLYWALVAVLTGALLALWIVHYNIEVHYAPSNYLASLDREWVLSGDQYLFDITERTFNVKALDGYKEGRRKWIPVGTGSFIGTFVAASANRTVTRADMVVGVLNGSTATAYPMRLLDHHRVINDSSTETATLVYFGAEGAGVAAYSVEGDRMQRLFGLTGLVSKNCDLLFDRATESLFSPIEGAFIAGERIGAGATLLPSAVMSLSDWLEIHPDSRVMSLNTGVKNMKYPDKAFLTDGISLRRAPALVPATHALECPVLVVFTEGLRPLIVPFDVARRLGKRTLAVTQGPAAFAVHFDEEFETAYAADSSARMLPCIRTLWQVAVENFPDARIPDFK